MRHINAQHQQPQQQQAPQRPIHHQILNAMNMVLLVNLHPAVAQQVLRQPQNVQPVVPRLRPQRVG